MNHGMGSSLFDGVLVGAEPSAQLAQSTPYQLRAIVLDYLAHHGYTRTAAAFARESTVHHLDADGDEIAVSPDLPAHEVACIEQRKQIYHHIQCGRVDEATALLKSHFPAVLAGPVPARPPPPSRNSPRRIADVIPYACATSTDPKHLALNLRVLAFIEACRTRPLHYPPRDNPEPTDPHDQMTLLNMLQKLLAHARMLPNADRKIYIEELNNVGGLLAYKIPEESATRKYLAQERRDAVADQIHRAILESSGVCSISSLELLVRYTSSVWYFANKMEIKPRPGAILPPTQQSSPTKEPETVPIFDLGLFLDQKT